MKVEISSAAIEENSARQLAAFSPAAYSRGPPWWNGSLLYYCDRQQGETETTASTQLLMSLQ